MNRLDTTIDEKKVDLSDIVSQVEWLLKSEPRLIELLEQVKIDPASMEWIGSMPTKAQDCNKKFKTSFTAFDIIKNALVSSKKERVNAVMKLIQNQWMVLDKQDAQNIYELWYNVQLPENKDSKKIISLLLYTWFINSIHMPQALNDFLDAVKSSSTLWESIIGWSRTLAFPTFLAWEYALNRSLNKEHEWMSIFISACIWILSASYFKSVDRKYSEKRSEVIRYLYENNIRQALAEILNSRKVI